MTTPAPPPSWHTIAVTSQPIWTAPSLIDSLYMELRERILTGGMPGGTRLTEMDIAVRFSVSRPSAKAAVERLVHDGLLARSTNKTARVPILTVADVEDLYYARKLLEREMVREVATRGAVPTEARAALDRMRGLLANPGVIEWVEADLEFHNSLVEELGSPRLTRLYASLSGETHLTMAQVKANGLIVSQHIIEEHQAIINAIEAGDADLAVTEVTNHLEHARRRLTSYLHTRPATPET